MNKTKQRKTQRVKTLDGHIKQFERDKRPLPNEGEVKRYIVTSAQNATAVHPALWQNLMVLAMHYRAEMMVSRFRYVRNAPIAKQSEKPAKHTQHLSLIHISEPTRPY